MFHRKFISMVLGAAVAITSISATSARAQGPYYSYQPQRQSGGNEAVAAALAGIAALYIIGKTIERHDDGRDKAAPLPAPKPKHVHKKKKKKKKAHHKAHRHDHGHRSHRHNNGHRHHNHRAHNHHGGHAHWHRHGNMKHIHSHGRKHHHGRH